MAVHQHRTRHRLDAVAAQYRPIWGAMEAGHRDAASWPLHVYVPSAAAGDAAREALCHYGEQTVGELLA